MIIQLDIQLLEIRGNASCLILRGNHRVLDGTDAGCQVCICSGYQFLYGLKPPNEF